MRGRNNTTPIGDGRVGIGNATSESGKMIERAISENNLKYQLAANRPIKGVYNAVIRMINRWSIADRVRIFQEYGDAKQLPRKINQNNRAQVNKLNDLLAQAIIAGLSKNELDRIVKQEEANENRLSNDLRRTNAQTPNQNRRYLSLANMKASYTALKDVHNDKQLLKGLKAINGFEVEKYIKKEALPKLRSELYRLLNGYTKIKLASLAAALEINFEDGRSESDLRKQIANLVNTYVAIVLGQNKQKGVYASQFSANAINVIEDLLSMTSYSWVVGKTLMTDSELKAKRQRAMNAKKELKYRTQENKNITNKLKNKAFKNKTGINIAKSHEKLIDDSQDVISVRDVKKKFKKTFSGKISRRKLEKTGYGINRAKELFDIDNGATLRNIAETQYGIDTTYLSDSDVIVQVGAFIGNEQTNVTNDKKLIKLDDLINKKDKKEAVGKTLSRRKLNKLNNLKSGLENTSLMRISSYTNELNQDYSEEIPVVSFNSQGVIASEAVLKAVPVYVMGYSDRVGKLQSKSEVANVKAFDKNAGKIQALESLINSNALSNREKKYYTDELTKLKTKQENIENGWKGKKKVTNDDGTETWEDVKHTGYFGMMPSKMHTVTTMYGARGFVDDDGKVKIADPRTRAGNQTINNITNNNTTNNHTDNRVINNSNNRTVNTQAMAEGRAQAREEINNIINNGDSVPFAKLKHINSKDSTFWKGSNIGVDKTYNVLPIYDLSSTPENTDELADLLKDYVTLNPKKTSKTYNVGDIINVIKDGNSSLSAIASDVNFMKSAFPGLQQVGTSTNAVAATTATAAVTNMASVAAQSTYEDIQNASKNAYGAHMVKLATGGKVKAANTSTIIAGDPRRGSSSKPNPELMTVNWANKSIDVKPIPQLATGGTTNATNISNEKNSNVTGISRLTTAERNAPLNINVANGIVKFSKQLNDVTDDNSGTAIKVYTVNQSINDKIKVGDTEMSLFDVVYGIYASINNISSLMSTNNDLLTSLNSQAANINTNTAKSNNSSSSFGINLTNELDGILAGN